jgi:hypothetical protein
MALAFLDYDGSDRQAAHFRLDVGVNRFYSYAVGNGDRPVVVDGFKLLGDRSYESPLAGPIPESARGRVRLDVPRDAFDRQNADVQVLSFRSEQLDGPAVSEIFRVQQSLPRDDEGFTPIQFDVRPPQPDRTALWKEQQPVSSAMFLDVLAGLVDKILPFVQPLLGSLLSGAGAGAQATPPVGAIARAGTGGSTGVVSPDLAQIVGKVTTPENLKLLSELIQKLLSPPSADAGTPQAKSVQSLNGQAVAMSGEDYSVAMIEPVTMITAATALMPLLKQVLTPETIKAVLDHTDPTKIIGTVSQAIQGLAQLGLMGEKQEMEHLERLNPGTAVPDLNQLLQSIGESQSVAMELARNVARPHAGFVRVDGVRLHFAELSMQPVAGHPTAPFRNDRALSFPLTLETPRPISNATLRIELKDARSLRPLVRHTYPVTQAVTGRLSVVPSIGADQAARLEPGTDYLVCAYLTWPTRKGRRLGSTMTQLITIVGEYAFDRVEQSTELIPLNDVDRYRDFWHKSWQGTFDPDRRKVLFNCKYLYGLDPERTANAQMETLTDTEQATVSHEVGRLKSGLVLSLYRLNQLLSEISPNPPLGEAELAALKTPTFADRFSLAARTQVSFRGRVGDSAALWAFPEMKVQQIVLRHAEQVNDAGHVIRFGEQRVPFPMPALVHLIGVESQ